MKSPTTYEWFHTFDQYMYDSSGNDSVATITRSGWRVVGFVPLRRVVVARDIERREEGIGLVVDARIRRRHLRRRGRRCGVTRG